MDPELPDDKAIGSLESSAGGPVPVAPSPAAAAPRKRAASVHSLAQGTRLHEFELTDHIGEGGFSIVYRAWDHSLERVVALKEYMPGSLATRDEDTRVHVRNESMQATFDAGLRSFVNESKLLASFDHPSLVKVYRFWEANGTAYMVMPFYEGLTLKDTVRTLPGRPGEDWILDVLAPLAEALTYIHHRQCFHRDIAPDNVLMLADTGRPLLLDFGAARRVINDLSQALTVIVKAGYAPIEQYAAMPDMAQGPWTDVHALAAVVYWMITGDKPPPAISRVLKECYVPLAEQRPEGYSIEFLQAVDRALALRPENRTRSIEAFADELGLRLAGPAVVTSLRPRAAGPSSGATDRSGPGTSAPLAPTTVHPKTEVQARRAAEPMETASPAGDDDDDDVTVADPTGGYASQPLPIQTPAATTAVPPAPVGATPAPDLDVHPARAPAAPIPASAFVPAATSGPQPVPVPATASEPATAPAPAAGLASPRARAPAPTTPPRTGARRPADASQPAPDQASRSSMRHLAIGGALVAVAAVGGWFALRPAPTVVAPAPAPAPALPAAAPPAVVQTAPPSPTPAPAAAASSELPSPAAAAVAASGAPAAGALADAPAAPATEHPRVAANRARPTASPANRPSAVVSPGAAECARILQRLSLGESSPELLERGAALHCK